MSWLKRWTQTQPQQQATPQHFYQYKTRFSMLGTVGSGKTTICAGLVLAAQTLSGDMPDFSCRVLENTSDILEATSNLRRGRFPDKSTPYASRATEAGLLMSWRSFIGEKKIQVPICDIAGEDIQQMIIQHSHSAPDIGHAAYTAAQNLVNYVKDSDGFVIVVPASKALVFRDDKQLEAESNDIAFDPDVNLARILEQVINHKEQSHGKSIKGIAVCISKWDLLAPFASNMGMDVFDPSGRGLTEFMQVCFPATSMQLKACRLANVKYFPTYVDVERNADGSVKRWEDDHSPKIMVKDRRKPSYSEQSFVDLIGFCKMFAQ